MFGNVFRDMLFLMVMGYAFLVVWMLPFINPPTVKQDTDPPGNMMVLMEWPPGAEDVDLWVLGPKDKPVGYSRKSGLLWNLLRDDLGLTPDNTPSNFENAYTRGLVPGEYIINAHCYRCTKGEVVVSVEVSIKAPDGKTIKIVAFTEATLRNKEEITMLRFVVGRDGKIIRSSMNHVYRSLRSQVSNQSSR